MNYSINFPAYNSSDGIAFEIYLSGCNRAPRCKGCHNPNLWRFDYGKNIIPGVLKRQIEKRLDKFDNFVILGGEPFDQNPFDLMDFLYFLKQFKKPIWLYTSYEYYEIEDIGFVDFIDYLKTGRYDQEKLVDNNIQYGVKLASSNQKIINLKEVK